MLEKRVLTILELNWNQRLGHREDKIEHLSLYAHVVHTTAKLVISRPGKNRPVTRILCGGGANEAKVDQTTAMYF